MVIEHAKAPYPRFVVTAALHTLTLLPRRKMTYFAAFIAFSPLLIPLALVLPRDIWFEADGRGVFMALAGMIYVNALCPLMALFFGCMLIGEDLESGTFPYVLTRPIPRSAWVLGKFIGYWVGVTAMLVSSMFLTYVASTK